MSNSKVVIVIPGIPYPPINGHKLKIYNLIKILGKRYSLHIVTIDSKDLTVDERCFIKENSYKSHHFKISKIAQLFNLIRAIFKALPFQVEIYRHKKIANYLKRETINDDIAIFNLIRTGVYIDTLNTKSKVLDMVDLLSKSYQSSAQNTSSQLFKMIYSIESKRLKKYELDCVKKTNLTLMVNKEESDLIGKNCRASWIPNGVHPWLFDYSKKDSAYKDSVVFFGSMYYQPNVDAVIWFEKNVLQLLDPKIDLLVIGARPTTSLRSLAERNPRIKLMGFLEDPYELINSCLAVIAPMQNGGGIQNKILEAMALGKINVLTNYAANPIVGSSHLQHFFVTDSPKDMALFINDLLEFPDRYLFLGKNAQNLIRERYTWEQYEEHLFKQLDEL